MAFVKSYLNVPDTFRKQAMYVFQFLEEVWGIPVILASEAKGCHLVYTATPVQHHGARPAPLTIPFDEATYQETCFNFKTISAGHLHLYTKNGRDPAEEDLIGCTYRLLLMLDEYGVPTDKRDQRGIFRTPDLPPGRGACAHVPVADHHAAWLWKKLIQNWAELEKNRVSLLPEGKKLALLLTHDTDAQRLGGPLEILTNTIKLVTRGSKVHGRMARDGFKCFLNSRHNDPFFTYPVWKSFEAQRGAKSTFFLFLNIKRFKPAYNDCKSDVSYNRFDWSYLVDMAAEGWAVGLHAPICAKDHLDVFLENKQWLEQKLGVPLMGLRHHYWALDWHNPFLTFRKHVNAGFRFDASIAWQDVAGFRAGTSVPFRPFDPRRKKTLDIYELPTAIMDRHVIGAHGDSVNAAIRIIEAVKEVGGVAVLDWHTESAVNDYCFKGFLDTLEMVLAHYVGDPAVWFPSANQLLQHLHRRRRQLEQARARAAGN